MNEPNYVRGPFGVITIEGSLPPDNLSADPDDYIEVGQEKVVERRESWNIKQKERINGDTLSVELILEEAYHDWLNGNLSSYLPDPSFIWSYLGRDLTDEEVDGMMVGIYKDMAYEMAPGSPSFDDWEVPFPLPAFPPNAKRYIAQCIVLVLDMERPDGLKPNPVRPLTPNDGSYNDDSNDDWGVVQIVGEGCNWSTYVGS